MDDKTSRSGVRRKRAAQDDAVAAAPAAREEEEAKTNAPQSVAATPAPAKRKAPKPNRQRCKEFRERRKQHVVELDERVTELRQEVSELVMKKSIYTSKVMLKRHHPHGSLEKLIREYFTLFRYGVAVDRPLSTTVPDTPTRSSALVKAQRQWEFLQQIVDPETVYGDHKGPAGSIAQWGYYTAAYASFVGEVNRVNITGPEEDPILYCFTTYHVILSRNTVKYLFPHVLHNEPLVQRLIGLYVPCPVIGIFRFTADGHISSETANIELAEALLAGGCHVEDVAEIMEGFVISQDGQVPDDLQSEEPQILDDLGIDRDGRHDAAREKLRISYLLDEERDEEEGKENAQGASN